MRLIVALIILASLVALYFLARRRRRDAEWRRFCATRRPESTAVELRQLAPGLYVGDGEVLAVPGEIPEKGQ